MNSATKPWLGSRLGTNSTQEDTWWYLEFTAMRPWQGLRSFHRQRYWHWCVGQKWVMSTAKSPIAFYFDPESTWISIYQLMPTSESVEHLSTVPVEVILSYTFQLQSCQAVRSTIGLLADGNNTKETPTQRLQKVFGALHQSLAAKHDGWENTCGKTAIIIIVITITRISITMYYTWHVTYNT